MILILSDGKDKERIIQENNEKQLIDSQETWTVISC
jgi:hypothetical protein